MEWEARNKAQLLTTTTLNSFKWYYSPKAAIVTLILLQKLSCKSDMLLQLEAQVEVHSHLMINKSKLKIFSVSSA